MSKNVLEVEINHWRQRLTSAMSLKKKKKTESNTIIDAGI